MKKSMNTLVVGVTAGTLLAVPGCVGGESEQRILADTEVTSADCPDLADIESLDTAVSSDPIYRDYLQMLDVKRAGMYALDNDLPRAIESTQQLVTSIGESNDYADTRYYAAEFLSDPETNQLGLKATCAAAAGEWVTAESMLARVENVNTELYQAYSDDVERYRG